MALKCNGYGSAHGEAKGRLWFACGTCRWTLKPQSGPSKETTQAWLDRQMATLDRQLAWEAEQEALGLDLHG